MKTITNVLGKNLVYIDIYNLLGSNFYWQNGDRYNITKKEMELVGITNGRVRVHKDIIEILIGINNIFHKKGYCLYVKEGYRPKELYKLIHEKRLQQFGKEQTDRFLNMDDMPHTSGKTVDIAIWDPRENKEVYLRDGKDGFEALFVNFYSKKQDDKSVYYQKLQDYVINTMLGSGFRLGTKREYFHFNYNPNTPPNY